MNLRVWSNPVAVPLPADRPEGGWTPAGCSHWGKSDNLKLLQVDYKLVFLVALIVNLESGGTLWVAPIGLKTGLNEPKSLCDSLEKTTA